MRKRANGEGTVYQRKDGRWAAQLSAQGKPLYRYAKTKVEASKKLQILRSERDRGELAGTGDVSVSDWAVEWLEFKKSRVKPTTLVKYERDLRVNVIPYLGRVRLKNLNTKHVSNLHSTLLNKGQKPRTVLHVHRVLRTMLQDAMAGEMIHKNVASLAA